MRRHLDTLIAADTVIAGGSFCDDNSTRISHVTGHFHAART